MIYSYQFIFNISIIGLIHFHPTIVKTLLVFKLLSLTVAFTKNFVAIYNLVNSLILKQNGVGTVSMETPAEDLKPFFRRKNKTVFRYCNELLQSCIQV